MTTLKEILEQNNIEPFTKDDCFSRDKQEAVFKAIKTWLNLMEYEYEAKRENAQSDYMSKMCEGAKYAIRNVINHLE
jgi:AAA+ ATPase superfamily predicted ATPase